MKDTDTKIVNKNASMNFEHQIFKLGLVFIAISAIIVFIYFKIIAPNVDIPTCMWDSILGIYCPGCGGTRAVIALLHGDIILSLWYHPVVLYSVVIFSAFMLSQGFARITNYRYIKGIPFYNWYLYGALLIIVINVVVKNILRLHWNIVL